MEEFFELVIFQEVWFTHNLVEDGQIGQEFQSQIRELQKEERVRQEKDELKSRALIKKLQMEEDQNNQVPFRIKEIFLFPTILKVISHLLSALQSSKYLSSIFISTLRMGFLGTQ